GTGISLDNSTRSVLGGSLQVSFSAPATAALSIPYASSTAISASGTIYSGTASTSNLTVSLIPNALLLTGATGIAAAYAGSSCTIHFVRSVNGSGVATCASGADTDFTGALGVAHGGTNISSYTAGDILYASAATTLSRVASSTSGFVLALVNGIPSWVATT